MKSLLYAKDYVILTQTIHAAVKALRFVSGAQHLQAALIINRHNERDQLVDVQFVGAGKKAAQDMCIHHAVFPLCMCPLLCQLTFYAGSPSMKRQTECLCIIH